MKASLDAAHRDYSGFRIDKTESGKFALDSSRTATR